jgi:hypothetical protein
MSDAYIQSETANTHRVRGNPEAKPLPPIIPCGDCGAIGVHSFRTEKDPGHVIQCPNRRRHHGTAAENAKACRNIMTKYRTTHAAAITAWNHFNNPTARRNYDEAEDLSKPRDRCPKCHMIEPHECLVGDGFQRKQSYSDASSRVRMG